MFYTLTLNPAVDVNAFTVDYKVNAINRTKDQEFSPNGKGVNVSIVLDKFGIETTVMGLFGGFTGEYILKELESMKIETDPIVIDNSTRINFFIINSKNEEIKFVDKGPSINKVYLDKLISKIKELSENDYLSINGSLPNGINESFYEEILEISLKNKFKIILDISSESLKNLLIYKPFLIKPNFEELRDIFGLDPKDDNEVIDALKELHHLGSENVLLTNGSKGMYFSNNDEIYKANSPKVTLVSSACCGDASLGTFLASIMKDSTIEDALKKSSAAGANVAESFGLGKMDKIEQYKKKVEVEKIWQK